MSVLIKGGRIVTATDDSVGDVYIENGTVTQIGESLDVTADKTIDAAGKLVIPGAIDPHTHIEMFFGGTTTIDDFTSGTVAAAFGGTTTLVDFCIQAPGMTFGEALEAYHEKVDRCKPVIDVGFHIARHRPAARAARSRTSPSCPTRGSPPTSSSWRTRAPSWSTTRRSSRSWRSPPRPARS